MRDFDLNRFLPNTPPPPFASPVDVLMDCLPTLQPTKRIDVATWAETAPRRIVQPGYSGKWDNSFAPPMLEPMQLLTSRLYRAAVFIGPARSVKSESLILNGVGHAIDCRPAESLVLCQTKEAAKRFSTKKLSPMIRATDVLREKQRKDRGADNIHEKLFVGGASVTIGWPVIQFLSQNEYSYVFITDFDRFDVDVDEEGSLFDLALKRTQQAGSRGMLVAETSPGKIIKVDDWTPSSPHEMPPCDGLVPEYNLGTRGRYYWTCPECGELFRPDMATLHHEERDTPAASAATTVMICPHNGCVVHPKQKVRLNLDGVWLHEAEDGETLVRIDDKRVRKTDRVSWAHEGPAAAMQSWEQLKLNELNAQRVFEDEGDDLKLKATITLDQGRPYLPRVRTIGESLSVETLKALAVADPLKVAPASTRFVTIQVDVQKHSFVAHIDAWLVDLDRQLIDRIEITNPPKTAPEQETKRRIDPGRYQEDWDALFELLDTFYPVDESGYRIQARAMIIDLRGASGVTKNAYKFYRNARKNGYGTRVFLANNQGGLEGDRAFYSEPEKVLGSRRHKRTDLRTVRIRTDILKDELVLALTRKVSGGGAYRLNENFPKSVFEEFCAEQRTDSGWVKRKSNIANEAFDLGVYGSGLAIILKAENIDWSKPPNWAGSMDVNPYAAKVDTVIEPVEVEPQVSETEKALVRPRRRRRAGFASKGSIHG